MRVVMVTYLQFYGLSALLIYQGMCRSLLKYYKWAVPDLDRKRCLIWASDHQG
jgi:hypothetical protein